MVDLKDLSLKIKVMRTLKITSFSLELRRQPPHRATSSYQPTNPHHMRMPMILLVTFLLSLARANYIAEYTDGHGRKLSDVGVCSGLNIANVAEDEATSDFPRTFNI